MLLRVLVWVRVDDSVIRGVCVPLFVPVTVRVPLRDRVTDRDGDLLLLHVTDGVRVIDAGDADHDADEETDGNTLTDREGVMDNEAVALHVIDDDCVTDTDAEDEIVKEVLGVDDVVTVFEARPVVVVDADSENVDSAVAVDVAFWVATAVVVNVDVAVVLKVGIDVTLDVACAVTLIVDVVTAVDVEDEVTLVVAVLLSLEVNAKVTFAVDVPFALNVNTVVGLIDDETLAMNVDAALTLDVVAAVTMGLVVCVAAAEELGNPEGANATDLHSVLGHDAATAVIVPLFVS